MPAMPNTRGAAPDVPLTRLQAPLYKSLADIREESIGRMLFDASRACDRWAPKAMNRADREALAQDAVCLILRWETSGDESGAYSIDPGAADRAPSREVWRSRDDWRAPSNAAWILLHRAITQALKAPLVLGWRTPSEDRPSELPTDPAELERLAEEAPLTVTALGAAHARAGQEESASYSPIPDGVAVVDLAEAADIPLTAARALAYQSTGMDPAEASAAWGMTEAGVKNAASVGAAWLREHYPDPADLAGILTRAARRIRHARREELAEALRCLGAEPGDITDGEGADIGADVLEREAQLAVTRYRESCRSAAPAVVALETATRNAARREGAECTDPGNVVRVVDRAMAKARREEYARLAKGTATPARGAALETAPLTMPSSALLAKWLKAPTRARRETTQEASTREVRTVSKARKYVAYRGSK